MLHFYQQILYIHLDATNKRDLHTLVCDGQCTPRTPCAANYVWHEHHDAASTLSRCHKIPSWWAQPTMMTLMWNSTSHITKLPHYGEMH